MAGENSLADQVKTLQRQMGLFGKAFKDLSEKVKKLEVKTINDDEKEIKEIIETQKVIDEIIVSNADAIKNLGKEITKLQKEKERNDNCKAVEASTKKLIDNGMRRKCRYYNRGHCKYRERCKFYHPRDICKKHLESGKCDIKECSDRHPKVCKYWNTSNNGCKRKTECDFLHEDLAKTDVKDDIEDKQDAMKFECVGCKDYWTQKNCVVEHEIKNHVVYFCLNCDEWIRDKTKVLDENWSLKDEWGNLRRDV